MPIRSIILHSSDGREEGDVATLTGAIVSAHWYITRAGRIYHFVDNANTAYHAGKVNNLCFSNAASIGIEQEHFDGREEWPQAQVEAAGRLAAFLQQLYGDLQVRSHAAVAAPQGRKVDPVSYPWEIFSSACQAARGCRWSAEPLKEVEAWRR